MQNQYFQVEGGGYLLALDYLRANEVPIKSYEKEDIVAQANELIAPEVIKELEAQVAGPTEVEPEPIVPEIVKKKKK
jgi:hypothetical protein